MDKLSKSMTPEQYREDRKLRTLQTLVDTAGRRIVSGKLSKAEAEILAAEVRQSASRIIPDQMKLYDQIYGARFRHWIKSFCRDEN